MKPIGKALVATAMLLAATVPAQDGAGTTRLGPQGTAAVLAKGAGLISQLDQSILRRVPELRFWRSQ